MAQHIVIVDDNPDDLRLLSGILKEEEHLVCTASSGKRALAVIEQQQPELILLDIEMPEIDGYEACRQLKENEKTRDIPVIFISSINESFDKVKAFQVGGVDYITKPFQAEEALVRVNTHLTIRAQQKILAEQDEELRINNVVISEQAEKLKELACRDPLTGLPNRREFLDRVRKEESRFHRSGKPFTILLLDIDRFKNVNDTYGHACGDSVLIKISRCLGNNLRKQDIAARWGGEEFIVLLPETGKEGGECAAEKIRSAIEQSQNTCDDSILTVTTTVGVCGYDGSVSIEKVIHRADEALYRGKKMGRNQVVLA